MGINYSKCINQANKLQSMSYEYQRLYNSVMTLANNSSSYWQGEANQAFREEIEAWKREAISIKNEMDDLLGKLLMLILLYGVILLMSAKGAIGDIVRFACVIGMFVFFIIFFSKFISIFPCNCYSFNYIL